MQVTHSTTSIYTAVAQQSNEQKTISSTDVVSTEVQVATGSDTVTLSDESKALLSNELQTALGSGSGNEPPANSTLGSGSGNEPPANTTLGSGSGNEPPVATPLGSGSGNEPPQQ